MLRSLPPAGNPILVSDLFDVIRHLHTSKPVAEDLENEISTLFNDSYCFLFSTGRGGMTVLLRSFKTQCKSGQRTNVVVPSYTCYSVAASIVAAGLNVLVCDIDKTTLSYDRDQLQSIDYDSVLAIVSANLYGFPNDLEYLENIATREGVYMIDDAAQSLGATLGARKVGTFGHAGLFSLDKGKVITSINGGVVITKDEELADILRAEYSALSGISRIDRIKNYIKLITYAAFLHPRVYWLPNSIPLTGLGDTVYDERIELAKYQVEVAAVARNQLGRLEKTNKGRRSVAQYYREKLKNTPNVRSIDVAPDATPAYLRYPIRITDQNIRRRFLESSKYLGTSRSYPASIAAIPQLKGRIKVQNDVYECGRTVAEQIVTLPTHAYVTKPDVEQLCHLLEKCTMP